MAPRRVKVNKFDYNKLSASDVICPICRSILIKPITLPCNHGFCSSCFETTTQNGNVVCPLCRVRVGSWLRSATKSKKLINETFWQAIQNLFPLQVRNKLNGIGENVGDKFNVKQVNRRKRDVSITNNEKLTSNLKHNELQTINPNKLGSTAGKLTEQTSTSNLTKTAGPVNTVPKRNQTMLLNAERSEKRSNFLNNFATKEYTCRILCQNVSSKDAQKSFKESQVLIQKKNKRIQEITESEMSNDRSNSIESECLYFKPIDYRHNPPSEGLAPIKVPTRKPNATSNIKILAPTGQNQINVNYLQSAFARLCSPMLEERIAACKKENVDSQMQDNSVISAKRKHDKSENKAKKKIKTNHKPTENQLLKSKESIEGSLTNVCDTNQCKNSKTGNFNVPISQTIKKINFKQPTTSLTNEEHIKRSLQEQADFELATKLQQTYNQSSKYSTRSTVLKRMTAKNQVKMEGIMTPYKVK